MTVIRVLVNGASGRMGTRVSELARSDARFDLVPLEALGAAVSACDVIIDFSTPEGAAQAAHLAAQQGAALVVGTTGLTAKIARTLDDLADSVPVLVAPNTSLGMAIAVRLAVSAARALGPTWRVEIEESHHATKKDAPSGTALRIAEALASEADRQIDPASIRSKRVGEIVGEHVIRLVGPLETLEIVHAARSRDVFAAGALEAAVWLLAQSPGRYRIEDLHADAVTAVDP
jgi:4-hydroxy-tetrahydrodipicolinate reductase